MVEKGRVLEAPAAMDPRRVTDGKGNAERVAQAEERELLLSGDAPRWHTEEKEVVEEKEVIQSTDKTPKMATSVDPDELWYIHGKAYDLTHFVNKHPGGRDALIATQGRDCTALFESYHAFLEKPHLLLASFKEVEVSPEVLASRVTDVSQRGWFKRPDGTMDPLWLALKERCGKKLKELGEPRTMPWIDWWFNMAVIVTIGFVYYYAYLSTDFWIVFASAPVLGVLAWLIARLGHDGSHFSVSRHPWINWFSCVVGAMGITNPCYWLLLHSVAHHSETNQPSDPDLYHFDYVLRMTPDYPSTVWHKYQIHRWWVYGWWTLTVYGLTTDEPIRMMTMGAGTAPNPGIHLTKNRPWFWAGLATHLVWFWCMGLFIPFALKYHAVDMPKWAIFLDQFWAFIIYMLVSGFLFGAFSQVNHFSEGSVEASYKNTSWAQQQVETACNYCVDSIMWDIFSSGINIQIEHHLFPSLSVERLRALSPIVRDTCKEFGVDYKCYDTFSECLASVHRFLDSLAVDKAKAE